METRLISLSSFIFAFIVYGGIIAVITYYSRLREQTSEDWMVAGRTLGPVVVAFTYFATRLSASAYMGEPAWVYKFGWPYHWIGVTNAAFWLAATLLMTKKLREYSFNLGSFTIPDFIGQRFQSSSLRVYIAGILVFFYFLIIYSMFKGFVALVGPTVGIHPTLAIIVFAIITIGYVYIGGFRAVANTDVFQGALMIILAVVLWIISFSKFDFSYVAVNAKLAAMDPKLVSLSQEAGLFSTIGVICLPFYLFLSLATNPYCAIRFMTLKDTSRKTVFTFISILITMGLVCFLVYNCGLFARVLFPTLKDADTAIPTLLANLLPSPLNALMVFGILAAIMSTTDSLLHISSTCISRDIYLKSINPDASDAKVLLISRITIIIITVAALLLSFFVLPKFLSMVLFIAAGGAGILTIGPLLIALYWDKATKAGAWVSSLSGLAAFAFFRYVIYINVWERGVISGIIAIGLMYLVSWLTTPPETHVLEQMKKGAAV